MISNGKQPLNGRFFSNEFIILTQWLVSAVLTDGCTLTTLNSVILVSRVLVENLSALNLEVAPFDFQIIM